MANSHRPFVSVAARALVLTLLLPLAAHRALGQSTYTPPPTPLERQLSRMDFAITAVGLLTTQVNGTNYLGINFDEKGSRTVGELGTLRYTAKPYLGFEFNFGNARYTQNFTNYTPCPPTPTCNYLPGGAQNGARELTLGYVAHPPHTIFGIQPYLGAGGGTIRFKPTPYGGQGLPEQYRAVYYYQLGLEDTFPDSHFGMRLGFRQDIYLAPDFLQNYLIITRRARTSEPEIGFFVKF